MPPSEERLARILVALDSSAHARAALEAAATLAAELQAELLGLFVEDPNLLRLAALPFAREAFWAATGDERLEEARMARVLRAEADQLRRQLAAEAERVHVRWSFRVARGPVDRELLAAAEQVDLIVLGTVGRSPMRTSGLGSTARTLARSAPRSVALLRPGTQPGRAVVALDDGSQGGARALALATRLARDDHRDLVVLVPERTVQAPGQQAVEVERRLVGQGLQARVRPLAREDPDAVATAVREAGGRLFVLAAGHRLAEEGPLARLIAASRCPVVIAR
jgi:nucleotide-binding universal stress UspA family protein